MIKISYDELANTESHVCNRCLHITLETSHFPDNTLMLKTKNIDFSRPIDIEWYYENDAELFTIICLAKKATGTKNLFMPYIPHARMDRVKEPSDTFSLKYFAEVINSLWFDNVIVLDPHSTVSEALFDNLRILDVTQFIKWTLDSIEGGTTLFFPDAGAAKRYSGLVNLPYTYGNKNRDWRTGEILGLDICGNLDLIKGKTVLIVDDICSRGGTFYHSAKKLKELGADKIYLYITHCENTILEGEVLTSGLIDKVFTTNSIFNKEHEKIEVFSLD